VVDSKPEFSARFGCFGHEIHTLIAQGRSNKEIARTLSVAAKTVKTHMKHIFNKLNVARGRRPFRAHKILGASPHSLRDISSYVSGEALPLRSDQ
jgi:hypothetical protein